ALPISRFAAKAMVLSAASNDAAIEIAVRRIGPALVFERLWEETGCRAVVSELAGKRKHGFALERAVFLTVLHRLFVSWREDYAIAGVEGLDLHHLYRAMAWLGEELPEKEQDGRTPFAGCCTSWGYASGRTNWYARWCSTIRRRSACWCGRTAAQK